MSGGPELTNESVIRPAREGGLAGLVFIAVWLVLAWAEAPTPSLFAGLGASCVLAWRSSGAIVSRPLRMPEDLRSVGMGVVGIAAGAHIDADVLREVSRQPAAVALGVFGVLAASLLAGQLLRLSRDIDVPTALFASVAGGASGVSLAARELGADEAIVMAVQFRDCCTDR